MGPAPAAYANPPTTSLLPVARAPHVRPPKKPGIWLPGHASLPPAEHRQNVPAFGKNISSGLLASGPTLDWGEGIDTLDKVGKAAYDQGEPTPWPPADKSPMVASPPGKVLESTEEDAN